MHVTIKSSKLKSERMVHSSGILAWDRYRRKKKKEKKIQLKSGNKNGEYRNCMKKKRIPKGRTYKVCQEIHFHLPAQLCSDILLANSVFSFSAGKRAPWSADHYLWSETESNHPDIHPLSSPGLKWALPEEQCWLCAWSKVSNTTLLAFSTEQKTLNISKWLKST